MLQPEYEKDMEHSFLKLALNGETSENQYEYKMLRQTIKGLLPQKICYEDNVAVAYYDIMKKVSLFDLLNGHALAKKQIEEILSQLIDIMREAGKYLLSEDDFVIDPHFIYLFEATKKIELCYLIGYGRKVKEQLTELFEYFMKRIDYGEQDTVALVYALYKQSKEENCTYEMLSKSLFKDHAIQERTEVKEVRREVLKTAVPAMVEKVENETEVSYYPISVYIKLIVAFALGLGIPMVLWKGNVLINETTGAPDLVKTGCVILVVLLLEIYAVFHLFRKENQRTKMKETPSYMTVDDKRVEKESVQQNEEPTYDKTESKKAEEEVNESAGATELLCEEPVTELLNLQTVLILVPKQDQFQPIQIRQTEFVIGSGSAMVDYTLHHKTISRRHARLFYEDQTYHVEDLSSTNGTFLNGYQLKSGKPQPLSEGDKLVFAEVEFDISLGTLS